MDSLSSVLALVRPLTRHSTRLFSTRRRALGRRKRKSPLLPSCLRSRVFFSSQRRREDKIDLILIRRVSSSKKLSCHLTAAVVVVVVGAATQRSQQDSRQDGRRGWQISMKHARNVADRRQRPRKMGRRLVDLDPAGVSLARCRHGSHASSWLIIES